MRKLLIVDDESDAREFVRAILESEDWDIAEAVDGKDGLTKARELRPDLIILDVQMPEMNGFDVFSALAGDAEAGTAKVIMLTGVAAKTGIGFSKEEMGAFWGKEPDAYVEKPIEPALLLRTVARVMGE